MANDQAKRSLLDQLTASATQPPPAVPDALAPAVSGDPGTFVPPSLAESSATVPGSTANLESIAASPDTLNANVEATKQSATNDNPGFLKKLARVAGGMTGLADPASSPQAGIGAKIGALAGRTGNALAEAAGTPEQKQLAEERSQMPLKMAQIQNEREYRQGILGNKATEAGIHQQNADTKDQLADVAAQNSASTTKLHATQVKKIEAELQGMNYVDPNLAHALGRDDLADKIISPIAYQQQIGNVVKSRGFHTVDTGKDGPDAGMWVVDNVGRKIYQVSEASPANARGASYGANRPVQILNPETGMPEYAPAGKAYELHASPAGLGTQLMSKQAQFTDIYSGLGSMRSAINNMAQEGGPQLSAPTIGKLVMASRETDPTIAKSAFDTILGSEQLTPAQQDFVVAVQQLNERAMSLRNLAGMGNASDSLRAAIRATLPSAKSGDVGLMRKQLDAVTNLVDNLHTGVPSVNVPQGNVPKKGTTVPNSSTPLTLQEAQGYLQKAGGDANKARALAKQDGRSF
jgi:hypothetical protein